jgi:hypothetical protein
MIESVASENAIQELELARKRFPGVLKFLNFKREKGCDTPAGAIVSLFSLHFSHLMIGLSVPQLKTIFQRLSVGMVDFNASKASVT